MSGLIEAKASVTTPNDKVEQAELDRLGIMNPGKLVP